MLIVLDRYSKINRLWFSQETKPGNYILKVTGDNHSRHCLHIELLKFPHIKYKSLWPKKIVWFFDITAYPSHILSTIQKREGWYYNYQYNLKFEIKEWTFFFLIVFNTFLLKIYLPVNQIEYKSWCVFSPDIEVEKVSFWFCHESGRMKNF